jgi:hypothetical protein
MRAVRIGVVAASLATLATAAQATLVEGTFSGIGFGLNSFPAYQGEGTSMTGSFRYDTDLAVQSGKSFAFSAGAELVIASGGVREDVIGTAAHPLILSVGSRFWITGGEAADVDNRNDAQLAELLLTSIANTDLMPIAPPTDFAWLSEMDQPDAAWLSTSSDENGFHTLLATFIVDNFELHTVPEPWSLTLLLGPVALVLARRSVQRHREA